MTDTLLDAIESNAINRNNISFDRIRSIAGRDYGIWNELGRGRSILSTREQLNQYLYSYGPLIQRQWERVLQNLSFPEGEVEIIDYACGQGLASILFCDAFGYSNLNRISKLNLIEPSSVALSRARSILKCYCPISTISTINKFLDDLNESDLELSESSTKLHFFSNILDINGFDQLGLLNKSFSTEGCHWIVAVSHDRGFHGGSGRLRDTYNTMIDRYDVKENRIDQFHCNNGNPKPAIAFIVKLEI